jgi:hypothetical protein
LDLIEQQTTKNKLLIIRRGKTMKSFKGIVKGNTVILTEKTDLPDDTEALVFIQPLTREESVIQEQLEILGKGFNMGGIIYKYPSGMLR